MVSKRPKALSLSSIFSGKDSGFLIGGCADWWMCGLVDVRMCGWVDGWIGGCADWWMCGCADGWITD